MRKYIGRFAMDEGFVEDKKENIDKITVLIHLRSKIY